MPPSKRVSSETRETLAALEAELRAIEDLESAARVLEWDQATYMPAAGAPGRARQVALLNRLAHERRVSKRMKAHLDALRDQGEQDTPGGAMWRRAQRAYTRAARLPADFISELHAHHAASYVAWTQARPTNDFGAVRPYLERTLALSRRLAGFFPEAEHVADPLIEEADPGMTARSVSGLFDALRARLVPLVERIQRCPAPDTACLTGHFDKAAQLAFGARVARHLGYDMTRGRQDETHHPFMTRLSGGDIRITTRVREDDLTDALFSTIHEAGHAMYEQGIDPSFDGTPLGHGASMAMHESQSRLWENLVGRGRAFWTFFFPQLRQAFPDMLRDVTPEEFHRAINRVEPSLIRTDADEVTYNLHVMLRFDLELQLLTGELTVADLPDAWNARMEADLGLRPPDAASGVLQDVHWYAGTIGGAFQGYTLGNLIAAQLYAAVLDDLPNLSEQMAEGRFDGLRAWLTRQVHRHGARYLPDALLERATGRSLSVEPFMHYLESKYAELYRI